MLLRRPRSTRTDTLLPYTTLLRTLPFRGGAVGGGSPDSSAPGAIPHPNPSPQGEGLKNNAATLRDLALNSIEHTRWVPERSINRIRSMVEGRPDWVISRQRAWGVPIAQIGRASCRERVCQYV